MRGKLSKKIVLINCYFGKLPDYFDLYLQSCMYNENIDFLFITDQKRGELPDNVRFVNYDFCDFKKYIQKHFDFEITLSNPYKLCDYKPAYGFLLEEYLCGYDFWGHVDVDLILGKVDHFLDDSILDKYEKIYQLGHLCLYKNSPDVNLRFKEKMGMDYRKVFSTDVICVFDEIIGMQDKYNKLGIPTYLSRDMIDIASKYYMFRRVDSWISEEDRKTNNYKYQVFFWENGCISRAALIDGKISIEEFLYIHFPKRKMRKNDITANHKAYFITNNGFESKDMIDVETITDNTNYHFFINLLWLIKDKKSKWMRRVNKYVFSR